MGGAVGHLYHLYDNRDLTFGEIIDILTNASSGNLEKVSEKLDGMNLVFSWDISINSLKVARNAGNIKSGGLDAEALSAKFADRGNLSKAFNDAFKVLNGALGTLSKENKLKIFGPNANRWYSMEIIYTANPNVINYDSNNVVFHGWPVFKVKKSKSGDVSVEMETDVEGGVDILTGNIEKMQKAVEVRDWKVRGPIKARLEGLSDGSILNSALQSINQEMSVVGLDSTSTIRDYIETKMRYDVETLSLPKKTKEMLILRCLSEPGAPTVRDVKNSVRDESKHQIIEEFINSCQSRLKDYIRPIELAINNFAVELLKGLESTLIDNTEKEVKRLRSEVAKAISAINSSNDTTAMEILKRQMEKLKSLENITSPVEGVVFIYDGNAYKFTGSFAAANQILGLFKYGRGGKKLKM